MSFVNLEIYCNEKWITVHLNINASFLQYIYLLFFYCFQYAININFLRFCVYVSLPFLEGKKYLVYNWVICWADFLPFAISFFFRPGWLKTATFWKKYPLTVAMAKERSPIKVPSENEDLPNIDHKPLGIQSLNAQGFASNRVMLNSYHYYYHCCHPHY